MEIVGSVAGSIAGSITDGLSSAAGSQLGYLLHYDDNIEELKQQPMKLAGARERVQAKIDIAKRNGENIFSDVQIWLADVEKISAATETFLELEVNANKRCFRGWCVNPKQRYRSSKEAKKQTLLISDLLQEAGKFENSVSSPASPAEIISPPMGFSGTFKSRESIKKEIMEALKDDSVSIIGVCGMGGVGKTTLVKEIGKEAKESKRYDAVAMAVVSQTPNIKNIQEEIARMLGFTLSENLDSIRAGSLMMRIKDEKRILVILDDLWRRIKLDEIGIPFGEDHAGCKIVLTTRRKDVCDQMDCQKTFPVGTLTKQESWDLFKALAGPNVEDADLNSIARDVAARCGGLPIAIVTVARALKNKAKYVWMDAARQLRKSTPSKIEGMHENVICSLKLSLDYLESEAKSLFLFCSLFPEDEYIYIEDLVRYGTGLRWFEDVETMEEVRVRTYALVSSLISSFLLIAGGKFFKRYVKMHDVVRDVAQIIAPKYNNKFMVKAGMNLREWPSRDSFEEFTAISLMSNNLHQVPDGLEYPNLQTLLLQENWNLVVPNSFFQGMKNLKVLDLSRTQLLPTPESLTLLVNLRMLHLESCDLGDLSVIGKLNNLEILTLLNSNIKEIPLSFSQLSHLRLLDLNRCKELKLISHGVISCLHKLEELYMVDSFCDWGFEGKEDSRSNATLVELQALSRLTTLHILIPETDMIPDNMSFPFQNLTHFVFDIGLFWSYDEIPYLRSKQLFLNNISKIPDRIMNWLKRSEHLYLKEIPCLENSLHDLINEGTLSDLKDLTIHSCQIKYLLNTLEWTPDLTLHNLETLKIYNNPNLIEICHCEPPTQSSSEITIGEQGAASKLINTRVQRLPNKQIYDNANLVNIIPGQPLPQSFSKLKVLRVRHCKSMLNIIPSHLAQRLQNLKSFKASYCELVVCIFDLDGLEIAQGERKMLSSLEDLELDNLPKMTQIWKGDHQFLSLHNLKSINFNCCPELTKLFSPTILQNLICLEEIDINWCNDLEEIFEQREIEDQEKGTTLCKKDHTTMSQSLGNLTSIKIWHCFELKNLFTSSIIKSLVKLRKLELLKCSAIQEIVINVGGEKGTSTKSRLCFLVCLTWKFEIYTASLVLAQEYMLLNSQLWRN